ncbi:MAG: magnesium transporter [Cytophagales bacterium]|nr:magnesium transporter [Bernardetiaceae bacterium]MDW8204898.1 magnesium transporter [Cytophagales bacterium]
MELTAEWIAAFEQAVRNRDDDYILRITADMYPADISAILHELNSEDSKYVIQLLPPNVGADILSNLEPDIRKEFLQLFTAAEIAAIVEYMDSDDAVDLLNEQPVRMREEVMALLSEEQSNYIKDLLHYEPTCAGGLMATELVKANINWTVQRCIEEIRRQAENVEKIYSVYVVDDNDILIGRLPLKQIVIAKDYEPIKNLVIEDVIAVETYRDGEEVAALMQKYDLEAIPVVNVRGKLLGRITIDDIVDLIVEQADKDLQAVSGISEDIEEDDSVWKLTRARLPWLLIGMLGGILGARFIGIFERDLSLIPAMAFFIPLITATGGNVGIQSSTIVVQSLAEDSSPAVSIWQRLAKVMLVALLNGLVISMVVFAFNILIFNKILLAVVVSVALFSVVILASLMGTITPLILDRFGINPALASGPFITTANDLLGLAVYFLVARMIYAVAPL